MFIKEKRSLISSSALREILDRERWLALECWRSDPDEDAFWRAVVCKEGEEPAVVITQRGTLRDLHSLGAILQLFRRYYPDLRKVEIPVVHGAIAPERHPLTKNTGR